jgi:hypothetical protein
LGLCGCASDDECGGELSTGGHCDLEANFCSCLSDDDCNAGERCTAVATNADRD